MPDVDVVALVKEKMLNLDGFMGEVSGRLAGLDDRVEKIRLNAAKPPSFFGPGPTGGETLGGLVTRSAELKAFVTGTVRGSARVAVPGRVCKAIITTGADLRGGIQSAPVEALPRGPLSVLDLLTQIPLTQGVLQVVRQKTRATPGAAVQLNEGDVKQEQAIEFTTGQLIPEVLAAWVPVSRQAAQDVAGLQMLIDSELLYVVKLLEEDQVLNGTSTLAVPVQGQLTGLVTNAPAVVSTSTTALDVIADLLGDLMTRGVVPTGIVLNPLDALALTKAKTVNEEYLLGSPATAPGRVLWGVAWAVSTKQPQGTVLAGDFARGARLWFREDAVIEISSEHADYFVRNLLAVRCEERVVLELVQPAYFGKVALPTGT